MNKDEKTFLSQVKGWTPVIDVLAEELGAMTALVYGIAWRYCQMKDKVCRASKETIAAHAGISDKTVQRHLHRLVKAGYLIDLTPDQLHAPHEYKDAGRVQIIGMVEARLVGRTESPTSASGRSESPTRLDTESHLGRTESPTRRVVKKEERKNEVDSSSSEAFTLWQTILLEMRGSTTKATFQNVFAYTEGVQKNNGVLTVRCPTPEIKELLDKRWAARIARAADGVEKKMRVRFTLAEEPS